MGIMAPLTLLVVAVAGVKWFFVGSIMAFEGLVLCTAAVGFDCTKGSSLDVAAKIILQLLFNSQKPNGSLKGPNISLL